jgi:cytochrome c oxidase assembly protein subunit 15
MRIWEAPKSDGSLAPVASASDASRWNRLTPQGYRRVTLVAVWLIGLIVVTGGAVRLTHSGLGCTDWPTCQANRIYPEWQFHGWVEFGNRLVTGLVSIAVIVAVLGALVRVPRRRDLTWLSVGLVGGVVGQIVLGGIVVLSHLWPPFVMSHFILSQALVADAVVLFHRAGRPDGSVQRPIAAPQVRNLGRVLIVVAALAIVTGTVVTGTGPHSGSNGDTLVKRLPFAITTVARVHGTVDLAALLVITALVVQLRRTRAPRAVQGRAEVVLVFGILQAAIGYTQYLTGVPEVLVALHILGATLVWTAVLWFFLGLFESVPARADLADGDERDAQGATALLGDARHDEPDGDRTGRDLVTGR